MARFVDAIDLPIPIEAAFEDLADFSNTALWDPGVTRAVRLDDGPVRLGSRFEVHFRSFGRTEKLEYRITRFEPPTRIVLRGGGTSMRLFDDISFSPRPGGTRVTYEVRVSPGGLLRFADPLLDLALPFITGPAVEGLRERGKLLARAASVTAPRNGASQPEGPREVVVEPGLDAAPAAREVLS